MVRAPAGGNATDRAARQRRRPAIASEPVAAGGSVAWLGRKGDAHDTACLDRDPLGLWLADKRQEIVELLTRAYRMEMETVMSYLANATNSSTWHPRRRDRRGAPRRRAGGARPRAQIRRADQGAVRHDARLAASSPPSRPTSSRLEDTTDVVTVIKGVIEAEAGAIEHYTRIIEVCDGVDWATQDMVIDVLRDEEGHMRTLRALP